jgi:hypothetical protein
MANSKKTSQKQSKASKLSKNELRFNELFTNAVDKRGNSCFWGSATSNWEDRWDLQDKLAIMWFDMKDQSDGYSANVKSPEIAGRLQSIMQRLAKVNLGFVVKHKREDAKFAAQVAQIMVNNAFTAGGYKYRLNEVFYDALRHGTAAMLVDFVVRKRKVQIPVTKEELMTAEEKKKLKENSELPYREYTMVDKRDVVVNPKRINELYFDPNARNIHGDDYYCSYYFDAVSVSHERFLKLYKNRRGYKDVDKVKKAGEKQDERYEDVTLEVPSDNEGDYVHIVKMWDYDNDRYMERANDVFIKECPLPYNHKKLNVVLLTPFKLPEQLYGISLIDLLLPVVTQIEQLQNAIHDYVSYTTNPVLMVEKSMYNEFARHYRSVQPGLLLPVSDTSRAVAPLKYSPLSMDVFQALSSLQRDAVIASQHDPSQLGVIMKNSTATANVINKEVTDAYVNFVLENFIEGLNTVAKMVLALQYQFLTEDEVIERLNGKMEKESTAEPRKLRLDNMEVDIDWDEKTVNLIDKPGAASFLELNSKLFETEGGYITPDDLDVELTAESVEILSKALRIQQSKENFAQLAQYMVDPNDRQKVAAHPMPLINGVSFMEEHFEINSINKKHLLNRERQLSEDIKEAEEQNRAMVNLEKPIPEPGRSREHIKVHEQLISSVSVMIDNLKQGIQEAMQNPMAMQDTSSMEQLQKLSQVLQIAIDHIGIDASPVWTSPDQVQQQGISQQTPGGMGGNTAFGGVGNMGGGNPAMPNPIGGAGMQGGPGQMGGLT